ncbi:MAG: penicillin-binding protein 2 [Gammaproteobacteria bacterium]|nr:penicillin-binding protein 2 [Gammaproteobacteria bacterium]
MKPVGHVARLSVMVVIFVMFLVILIWRMLDLMVLDRQFLKHQGDARSLRVIDIPAYRGMITDRNGIPLAVSTPVQSVWVNPKVFQPTAPQLKALSKLLQTPEKRLLQVVHHYQKREFLYVKRQLPPALAEKIQALHIPGMNFQQEYKRYYPQVDSTAQLVGFTNIDDQGLEGIELAYQEWLMGKNGKKKVIKDRMGRVVEELELLQAARPGHNLTLSIDSRIQYLAYHALARTCRQFEANSGSLVVLDTQTGEILAVVNYPSFNPNARFRYTRADYRNRAVVDLFEPGSVIKPFSIASALETGNFTPHTVIDTRPSWMVVHGHVIRDVHEYGVLDVTGVLEQSSNVGVSKMVLVSPPEQLLNVLKRVGFGERTESGYPGESDGTIADLRQMNPFVLSTVSFGYGLSVTALQLAKAYLVFANEGMRLPVTLIAGQLPEHRERVLTAKTAGEMLLMMESVMERGTGRGARIPGYRVAGKTGTARIAGKNGYEEHRHIASFVGIAPVSQPRIIVVAVVHEPSKHGYYGAAVAAPLFSEVMSGTLRILNIPPDK